MIDRVIKSLESRNPFIVAKQKGIHVLHRDLGEIYGFYFTKRRIKFIFINESLDESTRKFTCAHELGHALLHPDAFTPKLLRMSGAPKLKIEREANEFATKLLIDGSHEEYQLHTAEDILKFYDLPLEMKRFVN